MSNVLETVDTLPVTDNLQITVTTNGEVDILGSINLEFWLHHLGENTRKNVGMHIAKEIHETFYPFDWEKFFLNCVENARNVRSRMKESRNRLV